MSLIVSYIDVIAENYPYRQVSALLTTDDPPLYNELCWNDGLSPIPQSTLDNLMLSAYQADATDQVNNYRTKWLASGYTYHSSVFGSDPTSMANITGTMAYIAIGAPLPPGFTWRDENNNNIPFTAAGFGSFYASCVGWVNLIYNVSWQHKNNISAITSISGVIAYDYTYGWPHSDTQMSWMMYGLMTGTSLNTLMLTLI